MTKTEVAASVRLCPPGRRVERNRRGVCRRRPPTRRLAAFGVALGIMAGYWSLPDAAAAAKATRVTVTLNPSAIVADGQSQTQAAAAVTDRHGRPVSGETVTFSSTDPGQPSSIPALETRRGIYTARLTSTTTLGTSTITATDQTAGLTGTATLTQAVGPAVQITVMLTPAVIPADGRSQTTAAATITDSRGHPETQEAVTFSSTDPGEPASIPTSESSPGTYTATLTSTTSVGQSTITATDGTGGISSAATLTQTVAIPIRARPRQVAVALTPSTLVADGRSTAIAMVTVTDDRGHPISGDTVGLSASDNGVQISPVTPEGSGTYTATLTSSTRAGSVAITAIDLTAGVSTATTLTQVHGPPSNVAVVLSPGVVVANGISNTTATISVADANGNPIAGDLVRVSVSDKHVHVGSVAARPDGTYTVLLTSSTAPTTSTITASDVSDSPPAAGTATLVEVPAPSLVNLATMQWTFYYTPHYTMIRKLVIQGGLRGSVIQIRCRGGGCPFGARHVAVPASAHCVTRGRSRRCPSGVTYDVAASLRGHHLSAGATVMIDILRRGWIGKYYAFRMRSGRGPQIRISCLQPGATAPSAGC